MDDHKDHRSLWSWLRIGYRATTEGSGAFGERKKYGVSYWRFLSAPVKMNGGEGRP